MSKGGVKDVLDPKDVNAYGFYKLRCIKKVLFELAQILPKNIISFKIALILRKITLRNKVKIIETLWRIIYSNNEADMYESNLMRRLSGLLYIDSKLMGDIKKKIKKEIL